MSKTPGRPTVITPEVVSLLVSSFHNGLNVREACWQSGISHEAYYNRLRSDEKFADIIAKAQAYPTSTAKQVVIEAINKGDLSTSKWWLERKAINEFGRNSETAVEEEPKENHFASMSDDDMKKFGIELLHVLRDEYGFKETI